MQQDLIQIIIPLILLPALYAGYWRLRLKLLKRYRSPNLGVIEVLQKYNGERLLTINTYAQGVSIEDESIKKSYWYCIADKAVKSCKNIKNPQVLMLGLGANTISALINKLNPNIHQTVVEFDESIIQACRDFFGLDELKNLTLIQTDAYKLFNRSHAFKKKFNVLIVDIFTGKPPYVSLQSNQPNFIEKLLPYIIKEGIIIFNRPGNTEEAREDNQKLCDYLATLFKNTDLFDIKDPRGYRNNVIVGIGVK